MKIALADYLDFFRRFHSPGAAAPSWDAGKISDEWFRAHFDYAADLVYQWLGPVCPLDGAKVMNFGCGDGITDLGLMLRHGARSVLGIDIREEYSRLPRLAREQLGLRRLPPGLRFKTIRPGTRLGDRYRMDAIISWSTFEHIQAGQLAAITRDLFDVLAPGGYFFLQIEPLYFSPFGSHLGRYHSVPWHHLLLPEAELWATIQAHQGEIAGIERDFGFEALGAEGYKKFVFDEYLELNKITADGLVGLMTRTGFSVERQERRTMDMAIPPQLKDRHPASDLLTNEILLLLRKPPGAEMTP